MGVASDVSYIVRNPLWHCSKEHIVKQVRCWPRTNQRPHQLICHHHLLILRTIFSFIDIAIRVGNKFIPAINPLGSHVEYVVMSTASNHSIATAGTPVATKQKIRVYHSNRGNLS